MSWLPSQTIIDLNTYLSQSAAGFYNASQKINTAGNQLIAGNYAGAGNSLKQAATYLETAANKLGFDIISARSKLIELFVFIDENLPSGSFDMDVLLSTMLGAEFEQFREFIGLVDAYRTALLGNWFNYEYYAALARGFKEKSPLG